jgi:hypothetical protein
MISLRLVNYMPWFQWLHQLKRVLQQFKPNNAKQPQPTDEQGLPHKSEP